MYDDLVKRIKNLIAKQEVVVVAISGHGGSGKSTLAEKLAHEFDVADNQIVRVDNIHAQNYEQTKGLFELHDWKIIMDLLSNIHTTTRMKYKTRDWKEIEGMIDVARPQLVMLEGIRLIRPETLTYIDLSVWIDCPLDVATKRAVSRNREQGDSEAEISLWDTKWMPEAKQYVEQIHPEKIADFIYSDL